MANSVAAHKDRILKIMLTILWMAANRMSMRKIRQTASLLRMQGVNLGRIYVNKTMARDFLMSLAHVIRLRYVIMPARNSPALGLMIDESMDVSKSENMVLYLRFLCAGIFVTRFWRIVKCHGATAILLAAKITATFEEDGISTTRLFSLGTDGASVMTGHRGGVAVLLCLLCCAFMLSCHCIAHRQALSAAAASNDNEVADFLESAMNDILSYHTRSAKRSDNLENIQAALQVARLRIVKWVKTRWLSRGNTARTIQLNLVPLAVEFNRDRADCVTAGPLYEVITSHNFVTAISIFSDLLSSLNLLNLSFQVPHPMFLTVMTNVKAFLAMIETCYLGEQFIGGAEWRKLEIAMGESESYLVPGVYKEQVVVDSDSDEETIVIEPVERNRDDEAIVIEGAREFCRELVCDLKLRFYNGGFHVIIAALSACFDFRGFSITAQGNFTDPSYGDEEMKTLIKFFGFQKLQEGGVTSDRVINPVDSEIEWPHFKQVLLQCKVKGLGIDVAFRPIFENPSQFTNMRALLSIFMCLCLSTVCCEAGFSLMASIMTAIRNCMNIMTLDACMQIASNCPSFHHDDVSHDSEIMSIVHDAFEHWQLLLQRYPGRSNGKQGRKKKMQSRPLADVFEEQAKAGRKASGGTKLLDESDTDSDSNNDDDEGRSEEESPALRDREGTSDDDLNFSTVGDFEVPDGWVALDPPAVDEAAWASLKKTYKWQNKKLAHIWNEPTGWQLASFTNWDKKEKMCCFYY